MAGKVLGAQRQTEVIGRVAVLARLEIGQCQVEPHPGQIGIARQHRTEPGDGILPVPPCQRDRAVQEVEIVDVPFARLDALQQELGVVHLALRKRRPGGLDQDLGGNHGAIRLLCPDGQGRNAVAASKIGQQQCREDRSTKRVLVPTHTHLHRLEFRVEHNERTVGQDRSCRIAGIAVGASENRRRSDPIAALVGTVTTQADPDNRSRSMIHCIVERKSARSVAGPGARSGLRSSRTSDD